MIDKNDYTIYKKYEGDRRNYNYKICSQGRQQIAI